MELMAGRIEYEIGPIEGYAQQCHAASIALVKSGLAGKSRVARGTCRGVGGQHSWVVVGDDCYDPTATIIDLTAWSYGMHVPRVWMTTMAESPHRPHGWGNIMEYGCPESGGEEAIELIWPEDGLPSDVDLYWLEHMFEATAGGPLDRKFWMGLANGPVQGWPAAKFIRAMVNTPDLKYLVPIDRVGMLSDLNPSGLYLAGPESKEW